MNVYVTLSPGMTGHATSQDVLFFLILILIFFKNYSGFFNGYEQIKYHTKILYIYAK